jgi:hypothetical protein
VPAPGANKENNLHDFCACKRCSPVEETVSRYKGRQSAKAVEKDFRHFVDMVMPPGGLGSRLDAM